MLRLSWHAKTVDGHPIRTSLTDAEADCLAELAKGTRAVEIGSAYGFSGVIIGRVAQRLVCVDPHDDHDSFTTFVRNLDRFGVRAVIARAAAEHVLPMLQPGFFDLAFVDGNHAEPHVVYDVVGCLRLLRPGGVLAVHDYNEVSCPDVKTVVDRLGLKPDRIVDTLFVTTKGSDG